MNSSTKMPKIPISMPTVKQMTNDATTMFSRALQYTEEKFGSAEKTDFDANFEKLMDSYEKTKKWTEKLKSHTEMALQPNPNTRLEDKVYLKLDKKPPERQTNFELLGMAMVEAGSDFGATSSYGSLLAKCGESEIKIADAEQEFFQNTIRSLLHPYSNFLEGDSKTIQRERKLLENKRLDLDAIKNKVKKSKNTQAQKELEAELRVAQTEFDRQQEITRLLLEGISSTQAHHVRGLIEFIDAQTEYYHRCHKQLTDLKSHINSLEPSIGFNRQESNKANVPVNKIISSPRSGSQKARVLYDYEASDGAELSLLADEIVTLLGSIDPSRNWVMAKRGESTGRVPVNYLTMID